MDKQYFLSAGIPPLHFQPSFSPSPMSTWQPLSSAPPDTTWEKSTQHYSHLESALSSSPTYTCCYTTPMNSPPKLHIPIVKQNSPILTDPEFAQRAAKFSSFGSHSFNDRTSQLGINNTELQYRSNSPLMGIGRLSRISSSPSLKPAGSPMDVQENINSAANSNEDSYIEQIPTELKTQNHSKYKKRKPVPSGKQKELPSNAAKEEAEADDDSNAKRSKLTKTSENMKAESNEGQKQGPKPPEPPKDYIHVRARRGQATDSHSLAERVRREKISERMKLLQDLVPGCNKVTGKAPMLDEIINYVQSLQHQVEFLSMKLASVNPSFDFNMDSLLSKDIFQPTGSLPHPSYYPHQPHQNTQGLVDPFQLPPVDGFGEGIPQFPTFFEDDLQSIFQMGFGGNPNRDTALPLHTFPAPNQASSTKN